MNLLNKNFLANELVKWRDSGLVDEITAGKIAAKYDIDLVNAGEGTNFILRAVAYLFFALSLLILVGANWEELPRFARLLIVLFVVALVNFGGFYAVKKGNNNQGVALFLLGNFCYGAAIALIAQIYNLGEHMPNGVLLWAIGAFALSFAMQNALLITQSLIIAAVWFVMELGFGFVMDSFVIFLVLSAWVFWLDSAKHLAVTLFASIYLYMIASVLVPSLDYKMHEFLMQSAIILALGYSIFAVAISLWFKQFDNSLAGQNLSGAAITVGVATLVFGMMFFTEAAYYGVAPKIYNDPLMFYGSSLNTLHLVFCAIAFVSMLKFRQFYLAALCVLFAILPLVLGYFYEYSKAIFSFLSVLAGVALIKQEQLKTGLSVIFLVAIVRYIDLIGDYIGASLLFLAFAVTVLVISKKRSAK